MLERNALGERVRSFDFAVPGKEWGRELEGERAAYCEGLVVGHKVVDGCEREVIYVERQVSAGKEVEHLVGELIYPPVNGVPRGFSDNICDGIEVIS